MGFIGRVQVEDANKQSGYGMLVHQNGSIDVNILNDPLEVEVQGTVPVSLADPVTIDGCVCAIVTATATVVATSATTSSATLLNAGARHGVQIKNLSATSTVYIDFGGTAAAVATGYPIGPGETVTFPAGVATDQKINIIGATGGEAI